MIPKLRLLGRFWLGALGLQSRTVSLDSVVISTLPSSGLVYPYRPEIGTGNAEETTAAASRRTRPIISPRRTAHQARKLLTVAFATRGKRPDSGGARPVAPVLCGTSELTAGKWTIWTVSSSR